jgi:hypothetical protein
MRTVARTESLFLALRCDGQLFPEWLTLKIGGEVYMISPRLVFICAINLWKTASFLLDYNVYRSLLYRFAKRILSSLVGFVLKYWPTYSSINKIMLVMIGGGIWGLNPLSLVTKISRMTIYDKLKFLCVMMSSISWLWPDHAGDRRSWLWHKASEDLWLAPFCAWWRCTHSHEASPMTPRLS